MPLLPDLLVAQTHTDLLPTRHLRPRDDSDSINHGTIGIIIGILIVTAILSIMLLKIIERRRLNRGSALFQSPLDVPPHGTAEQNASRYASRPLERERGRRDGIHDDVMSVVDPLPLYEPRKSLGEQNIVPPPPAYTRD